MLGVEIRSSAYEAVTQFKGLCQTNLGEATIVPNNLFILLSPFRHIGVIFSLHFVHEEFLRLNLLAVRVLVKQTWKLYYQCNAGN